jgi:TPR repeat protein
LVERNQQEAIKWYKKAAEQGDPAAQCKIGDLHFAKEEYEEAVAWYNKAAEQKSGEAYYKLHQCYFEGLGVQRNLLKGRKYLELSVAQEYGDALHIEAQLAMNKGQMTPKAWELFNKAANKGSAKAQTFLGICYDNGSHGCEKNIYTAMEWYKKAADQGYMDAQFLLGVSYFSQNDNRCIELFKKAAEQGHARAQYALGVIFENNQPAEAIKWYKKAAAQGDEDAKKRLQELGK